MMAKSRTEYIRSQSVVDSSFSVGILITRHRVSGWEALPACATTAKLAPGSIARSA
ncbi:hypothetical protein [Mesorhizobium sp.]|uniref:hypothetical protein n=1 Tax=Mesorhizobium sp. TaxID=1871066 RepID=UPI0025E7AB29|nr:hypothetical protein [Mesorhizobium sp.]